MLLNVSDDADISLQQYLETFLTTRRIKRMHDVLNQRTRYIVCVLEDLYDPRNGSAVMRHCDALGIQEVHVIENTNAFRSDKQVDLGSAQWLDLKIHRKLSTTPQEVKKNAQVSGRLSHQPLSNSIMVLEKLKRRGFRIAAATPRQGDEVSPETLDLQAGPVAVVFGTEKHGISEDVRQMADVFMTIPMFGFVESFNISASAAIVFHVLSGRIRSEGLPWSLDRDDLNDLYFQWVKTSVPNAEAIIRRFRQTAP